jgi:hypothetical protein
VVNPDDSVMARQGLPGGLSVVRVFGTVEQLN